MTLLLFIFCQFLPCKIAGFGETMTRISSTELMISKLGHFSKLKVSAAVHVISRLECLTRCLLATNCSVLLYGNGKQCQFGELTWLCHQAVNLSATEMQNFEVWIEKYRFEMQKSSMAAVAINKTFRNSTTGPYGHVQTMPINRTGCYNVTAKGARSGRQMYHGKVGCPGAVKGGSFMFNSSDELRVVVGQEGGPTRLSAYGDASGAGGASFVFTKSGDLLLAAGGAGGVKYYVDGNCSGQAGSNAGHSWGDVSFLTYTGYGGKNGTTTGGFGPDHIQGNDGGMGASWFSSGPHVRAGETWGGTPGHNMSGNFSGGAAPAFNDTNGLFEAYGGFGGGGSGSPVISEPIVIDGNGGSGGGYSSGGVGSYAHSGGGGSSFASPLATNVWGITGGNTEEHGSVTFTYTGPCCG